MKIPAVGAQQELFSVGCPVEGAVDAADNIFVDDLCGDPIAEYPAGCTSDSCSTSVGNGLNQPVGVGLDPAGDVYIPDSSNNRLQLVQRSQAPTLAFPSTTVFSVGSPMTVTVQNIGNQWLTFASFAGDSNFTVNEGATTCSTSAALAPGGLCNVGVEFAPQSVGSLTGTLTITDNALNASSAQRVPLTGTATPEATTVSLVSSANPSTGGQTVSFTVTVSPAPTSSSGLGSVTLKANGTVIASKGLLTADDGVVTLSYSSLLPGTSGTTYSIQAFYSGSSDLGSSTSSTVLQTVNPEATTTTLMASSGATTWGQSVTFTATVATTNGATPAGPVVFKNGSTVLGNATLAASGSGQAVASLSTSALPAGTASVSAGYGGSNLLEASASPATTITVSPASSTTVLSFFAMTNFLVYSQPASITATVTPQYGGSAGGTLTFTKNGANLNPVNLSNSNTAMLNVEALAIGEFTIGAAYNGDSNVATSTAGVLSLTVEKAYTTTATSISPPSPVTSGTSVTITATVSANSPATATPVGTVEFYDTFNGHTVFLGNVNLSGGVANLKTSTLAVGAHSIYSTYTGSDYENSSSSAPVPYTVNQ